MPVRLKKTTTKKNRETKSVTHYSYYTSVTEEKPFIMHCSFWYGLKDLFTQHKLANKVVLDH